MSKFKFKESLINEYLDSLEKNPVLIKNKKISDKVEILMSQMDKELDEKKNNLSILLDAHNSLIDSDLNDIPNYQNIIKDIKYNIFLLDQENFTLEKLIESNNNKYTKNKLYNEISRIKCEIDDKIKEKKDLELLYNQKEGMIEPENIEIISNSNNDYILHLKNRKKNKSKRMNNLKEIDKKINGINLELIKIKDTFEDDRNKLETEKIKQIKYFENFDNQLSNSCKDIKLKFIEKDLVKINTDFELRVKELEDEKRVLINSKKEYNEEILFLNKRSTIKKVDNTNIKNELINLQSNIVSIDKIIENLNGQVMKLNEENERMNNIVQSELARNNGYLYNKINNNKKLQKKLDEKLNNVMLYKTDIEISNDNAKITSFENSIIEYEKDLLGYKKRYQKLKLI